MNKAIDRTNLNYLGIDFQYQLTRAFMEEPKFFREVKTIVNQNAFTDNLLKRFVGTIKDYYSKWDDVPTYQTIETMMRDKAKTTTDIEEIEAVIEKIKSTSLSGVEETKDKALKFFKQQAWLRVSNEIRELVINGGDESYEDCAKKIEELTLVGNDDEFGFSPYDIIDQALSPTFNRPVPTGISKLDDAMNGGLDKGKMGMIIGSAGFGKSTFSTCIACAAATNKCALNNFEGYKVLQIFFEDDTKDMARKVFSHETQVEARYLSTDEDTRQQIYNTLINHPDKELIQKNYRMKKYNTGTQRASDIEAFIKALTNTGFKPDLVIIDYFECLLPEKGGYQNDSEWTREGVTMRKLENMAKDLDIALWVPTQGNKDSIGSSDLVTMDKAGGSIKKVQIAQVVISIARSMEDIDNSRATLAILKNRSGKSGQVFQNIIFNNGTSTISCEEVTTFTNSLVYHEFEEKTQESNQNNLAKEILWKNKEQAQTGNFSGEDDFAF